MKTITFSKKNTQKSLHEKNLNIHKNLWKVYSFFLFIGLSFVLIQGLN